MRFATSLAATLIMALSAPAAAQTYIYEEVVEEWVETSASRIVSPQLARAESESLGAYGPFRVVDASHAAIVGVTNGRSPADFERMLAAYPGITTIYFVDCPGTHDDRANFRLGRMIRARGIAAIVPEGGSVRSGAVDLFLAGAEREIADGSEFAVHAWLDYRGRESHDYAPDSPEHRKYLDYYREMGMEQDEAVRFYAMTNSVPFESALWLSGEEMRDWIVPAGMQDFQGVEPELPRLAYLDLDAALN